ncbi:hypothetical protein [Actinomadura litoris]|uniref:hypothetical protein n=1 Tax=Actinomadura litoris TaxID=2678616 RepID=UPI001FA80F17|nr:hypothetical protein [Actinomadura litoris]
MTTPGSSGRIEEMTVRVPNHGFGLRPTPLEVSEVTVKTRCPECGGPRGRPGPNEVRASSGQTFEIDRWVNPCGHVDLYADVLIEARVHPPYDQRT